MRLRRRPRDQGDWRMQASCWDRANFRPSMWDTKTTRDGGSSFDPEAKQICLTICQVRDECLRYALARQEPDGVWGGLDPAERGAMRRGDHGTQPAG